MTTLKRLHVHLGPHKTGSTAIQHRLRALGLVEAHGKTFQFLDAKSVNEAARCLNSKQPDSAEQHLRDLSRRIKRQATDIILSCEDFAGDLPGRNRKRSPYPKLWENIAKIQRAFEAFECRFYFFIRDPQAWIKSAYIQNLKHRQKFSSLEGYTKFYSFDQLWDGVIDKSRRKLGDRFVLIGYEEPSEFSSVDALVAAIPDLTIAPETGQNAEPRVNAAPDLTTVHLLEKVNASSASNFAKRAAKRVLLDTAASDAPQPHVPFDRAQDWHGGARPKPDWLAPELDPLWKRVNQRVSTQSQSNVLPKLDVDLVALRTDIIEASEAFPQGGREDMKNQRRILEYRFRDLPQTCVLLGLCISYLRRDTEHTRHAALMFQRLWNEEYAILLGMLPTRWLISTLQTFFEHGSHEAQRSVGAIGYFFSNTLKAYEAEQALDGLAQDRIYANTAPVTPNRFAGLDRFKLGGTDLLLNLNALLVEYAAKDQTAGRVLQEFMLRTKQSSSIFSRMDQSRIEHGISVKQFDNCWSFFEKPK